MTDELIQIEMRVRHCMGESDDPSLVDVRFRHGHTYVHSLEKCLRRMLKDFQPTSVASFMPDGAGSIYPGPGCWTQIVSWPSWDEAAPAICTAWCELMEKRT